MGMEVLSDLIHVAPEGWDLFIIIVFLIMIPNIIIFFLNISFSVEMIGEYHI